VLLAVIKSVNDGGTPAYRWEFVAGDAPSGLVDFDAWVLRTVLNPQVPLFREARYLLAEETEIRKSPDNGHPLSVLEDARLIAHEADPFRSGRSLYRITEPLIVFYKAVMRREWTRHPMVPLHHEVGRVYLPSWRASARRSRAVLNSLAGRWPNPSRKTLSRSPNHEPGATRASRSMRRA
jgi:hypothetical protein